MMIPYRSKNPPESFPYGTIGLITLNVLIYLATAKYLLIVRHRALEILAVSHATILHEPWRVVTAMFLHASLSHIIGNMLFLGVFGPAVEGRLRTPRYLALYFAAGIFGSIFEDLVSGIGSPEMWSLGASGAIMGVVGAYLYMFPHTKVMVFFLFSYRAKAYEWRASWVIAFYIFFDVWHTILQARDGVGHLCHLGGVALGYCLPMLLNVKSDSASDSRVMELRQDCNGNYRALTLPELAFAMSAQPDNVAIVMAYCQRAETERARRSMVQAMHKHEDLLGLQGNPEELAYLMLSLTEYDGDPPPWLMLRVARRLKEEEASLAEPLCRRVLRSKPTPTGDLLEQTLLQLAEILERVEGTQEEAAAIYKEITFRFPLSASATHARVRILVLGAPQDIYFSLQEAKALPFKKPTAPAPAPPPEEY